MNFKACHIILLLVLCNSSVFLISINYASAQTDSTEVAPRITLKGYIKEMHILGFGPDINGVNNNNLIHNRLNFRFIPTKKITIGLEVRNRIFTGETVNESYPQYGEILDNDDGYLDLSWLVVNQENVVMLSELDRAWVNWSTEKWDVTVGRQRINWGVNLFWNANDLFNAYRLIDFDYEERPGSDAIRVQRYFPNMRSIDVAVKPGKNPDEWIGAAMYRFHYGSYDLQVLTGLWNEDIAIGGGWAGNLGNAGLKGEVTWFQPIEKDSLNKGSLSASISSDYVFSNQLFLTAGFLFNSSGIDTQLPVGENLFLAPLSAKNLTPMKYNFLINVSYPFSPIFSGSLVAIYSPGVKSTFFMPSFTYSVANNWEIAVYGQSFWTQLNSFENISNTVYVRLKWSF